MRVPCHLKDYREQSGRTQRQLATASGVASGTLSMIETGRMLPKEEHIPGLEQAYGHPIHEWYPPHVLLVIEREHEEGGTA